MARGELLGKVNIDITINGEEILFSGVEFEGTYEEEAADHDYPGSLEFDAETTWDDAKLVSELEDWFDGPAPAWIDVDRVRELINEAVLEAVDYHEHKVTV